MKQKRHTRRAPKKVARSNFFLRDAWDIMVIFLLLSTVVYFSYYVRNNRVTIPPWPHIKYVNVSVNGKVIKINRERLKAIVRQQTAGGFFRVPMAELESEIAELPWAYRATVQRFWPSTVAIKIYEQNPIARWGDSGLMNAYGEVFFPDSTAAYEALPKLYGDDLRSKELASVFESSIRQLKPSGLQIRNLFEDKRQSKYVVLSNGVVIVIGDGDVSTKIARFITVYEQYLAPYLNVVKKIDLRYTNGLAVEWKDPQLANNLELERRL